MKKVNGSDSEEVKYLRAELIACKKNLRTSADKKKLVENQMRSLRRTSEELRDALRSLAQFGECTRDFEDSSTNINSRITTQSKKIQEALQYSRAIQKRLRLQQGEPSTTVIKQEKCIINALQQAHGMLANIAELESECRAQDREMVLVVSKNTLERHHLCIRIIVQTLQKYRQRCLSISLRKWYQHTCHTREIKIKGDLQSTIKTSETKEKQIKDLEKRIKDLETSAEKSDKIIRNFMEQGSQLMAFIESSVSRNSERVNVKEDTLLYEDVLKYNDICNEVTMTSECNFQIRKKLFKNRPNLFKRKLNLFHSYDTEALQHKITQFKRKKSYINVEYKSNFEGAKDTVIDSMSRYKNLIEEDDNFEDEYDSDATVKVIHNDADAATKDREQIWQDIQSSNSSDIHNAVSEAEEPTKDREQMWQDIQSIDSSDIHNVVSEANIHRLEREIQMLQLLKKHGGR